jgi:hypothetical protein
MGKGNKLSAKARSQEKNSTCSAQQAKSGAERGQAYK